MFNKNLVRIYNVTRGYANAVNKFLDKNPHLLEIKKYIPSKYLNVSAKVANEYLYLICSNTAKIVADHVIPSIGENQIVAETNVGLGLITTELLQKGVKRVRMYESCPDFRAELKSFDIVFPGRVELFIKNIFHLGRFAYLDKQDGINRVDFLLKNVPKKAWNDQPAMTIVGAMPNKAFLQYLMRSLALQTGPSICGRIQIFAIMKKKDFMVLTATPDDNLVKYQYVTLLFQILFDIEKLETFPRNIFLPWERTRGRRKPMNEDMFFVKINFKKELPLSVEHILPFYYFLKQFYGTGNNVVIPTAEKWVPGSGLNVLVPRLQHDEYPTEINIFTKFRELTPLQTLAVFNEIINNPTYLGSPFTAMVENELIKSETIETSLADAVLEKQITGETEQLNLKDEFD